MNNQFYPLKHILLFIFLTSILFRPGCGMVTASGNEADRASGQVAEHESGEATGRASGHPAETAGEHDGVHGQFSHDQLKRGERLFYGLIPLGDGAESCASCHNTMELDTLNWYPSAYDIALTSHEQTLEEWIPAILSPSGGMMPEVHLDYDLSEDDLQLIKSQDFESEIMVEYKKDLNASKAITEVRERKEAKKAEAERIRQSMISKRQTMLRNITMVFHQMTQTFVCVSDDSIFIKQADIETFSDDEFRTKYVELENAVKAKQSVKEAPKTLQESPSKPTPQTSS